MRLPAWSLLLLAGFAAMPARADLLAGRVTLVVDGDSLRLKDARSGVEHGVRIVGIEAPDRRSKAGKSAHQTLAALLYNKEVAVAGVFVGKGFVGRVLVAAPGCRQPNCPKDLDAGLAQVEAGMAWWDARYSGFPEPVRRSYEAAEFQAKIRRLGLWAGRDTFPPWATP